MVLVSLLISASLADASLPSSSEVLDTIKKNICRHNLMKQNKCDRTTTTYCTYGSKNEISVIIIKKEVTESPPARYST